MNGLCVGCGVPIDVKTRGCLRCRDRHRQKEWRERRRLELAAIRTGHALDIYCAGQPATAVLNGDGSYECACGRLLKLVSTTLPASAGAPAGGLRHSLASARRTPPQTATPARIPGVEVRPEGSKR